MTPEFQSYPNGWQVQWSTLSGAYVQARNPSSRQQRARPWHRVSCGYLREVGIPTPVHRKDSWEIDWNTRKGKLVWARNVHSKMPSAKVLHWIDFHTCENAGIKWKPATQFTGRTIDTRGYVQLTRSGMSEEDIAIAHRFNLFRGKRKIFVREHQLAAAKKYMRPHERMVVQPCEWSQNRQRTLL